MPSELYVVNRPLGLEELMRMNSRPPRHRR
jgi:hypothetical protein